MPEHRPSLCSAPLLSAPGIICELEPGHPGYHGCAVRWSPQDDDEAPTQKLPPVRDSIGPRRTPPPLRPLPPGSVELLRVLADALAAEDPAGDEL